MELDLTKAWLLLFSEVVQPSTTSTNNCKSPLRDLPAFFFSVGVLAISASVSSCSEKKGQVLNSAYDGGGSQSSPSNFGIPPGAVCSFNRCPSGRGTAYFQLRSDML